MTYGEKYVLLGMSYRATGCEFNVNESTTCQIRYFLTEKQRKQSDVLISR